MPNDSGEQFISKLQKGTLFYWKNFEFPDGTIKNKFLLILSKNPQESDLIGILPTSKVENYRPLKKYSRRDFYIIEKSQSKYFPKSTALDFNSFKEIRREYLKRAYIGGKAKILGKLENEILEEIDVVVRDAYTLPEKIKERII